MTANKEKLTERRTLSQVTKDKGFNYIDHDLSLYDAMQLGETALQLAKKINAMPLSISILDKTGQAKYVLNEDGTGLIRNGISFGKAWTSLSMGFSSRDLSANLKDRPSFLGSAANVSNGKMIFAPGGVLLINKKNNKVVGAIGISGDTSYRDESLAITAAQQCGFKTSPSQVHPTVLKSQL
eukprot:UN04424